MLVRGLKLTGRLSPVEAIAAVIWRLKVELASDHQDVHHHFGLGLVQIVDHLFGQGHLVGLAAHDDGVLRVVGDHALKSVTERTALTISWSSCGRLTLLR